MEASRPKEKHRMKAWLIKLDGNDWLFYIGLAALFLGLSLSSIARALIVTGSILSAVSFINSLIIVWLTKAVE
jgi:hypothetical protein